MNESENRWRTVTHTNSYVEDSEKPLEPYDGLYEGIGVRIPLKTYEYNKMIYEYNKMINEVSLAGIFLTLTVVILLLCTTRRRN